MVFLMVEPPQRCDGLRRGHESSTFAKRCKFTDTLIFRRALAMYFACLNSEWHRSGRGQLAKRK